MSKRAYVVVTVIVLGTFACAPQGAPAVNQAGQGGGSETGQARGGRQGGGPAAVQVPSISKKPVGSELAKIRVAAENKDLWFGWRVAIPTNAIKGTSTFSEGAAAADAMIMANVEVSSTQEVAFEVPKAFDYHLQMGERNAVNRRLRELRLAASTYRVENFPTDEATRRKVFEFAKSLVGAPILVVPADSVSSAAELGKLASEYDVKLAIDSKTDPRPLVAALNGSSEHIGVAADVGAWMENGVAPVDGLKTVGKKLMVVSLSDRSGTGSKAQNVVLGSGVGALDAFLLQAYQAQITPLAITVESTGTAEADMMKNVEAFERVMLPAMAERVRVMAASPAGQIRGGDRLTADMRAQIDAAAPSKAIVTPKRPRKLLVTDIQEYVGHATVPHGNYLVEQIGKHTGAFTPTFSNDPELLKYPKIKEFDAVFLNNICGMVYNDPEVRAGLLRFVQEGGGLGGTHCVTFSANNWREFTELMGGWTGAHHVEKQMIKVDDPSSPITKSFGAASFEHSDEYYIFPPYSYYSREKQHVLLSIDVPKSDRATSNRFCAECTRPDQDYGLVWIKEYGKGRTYFNALGHTEENYTDPRFAYMELAGIQYILGDLDADATPSAKLADR